MLFGWPALLKGWALVSSIGIVNKDVCTGCGACEVACPMGCIAMTEDAEGFLVPVVDESRCVSCGKCLRVCPASSESSLVTPRRVVAFRSLDPETGDSSSGGAAYTLGKLVINRGGAVVACAFDDQGVARHVVVEDKEALRNIQGSKYVQSDARDAFRALSALLIEGREVLFVGTPCQVAAARLLSKNHDHLITCDLICHGVPSPGFWSQALRWNNEHGRLEDRSSIMFRSSDQRSRANFELYCKQRAGGRIPFERDAYYAAFIKNASLRESCYRCLFARGERTGDLTVGDCASRDRYPDFHPCESISSVLVNTAKGEKLFDAVLQTGMVDVEEIDFETEARLNKQLHTPSERPPARDMIYSDLASMSYEAFTAQHQMPLSASWWIKRTVKVIVPVRVRTAAKKTVRRMLGYGK